MRLLVGRAAVHDPTFKAAICCEVSDGVKRAISGSLSQVPATVAVSEFIARKARAIKKTALRYKHRSYSIEDFSMVGNVVRRQSNKHLRPFLVILPLGVVVTIFR